MSQQNTSDISGHAFYVTSLCHQRRRLLEDDKTRKIVIGVLGSQLAKQKGKCAGFVVMPNHVHAIVWFDEQDQLSHFMKQWKQRSSVEVKKHLFEFRQKYLGSFSIADPVWQSGYHSYNLFSIHMLMEKLEYMHNNPVRAKLAQAPEGWQYSSARWYVDGKSVGLPIELPEY